MDAAPLGLIPQRPACTVLTPSGGSSQMRSCHQRGWLWDLPNGVQREGCSKPAHVPREATGERLLPARTPKPEPSTSPSLNWPSPPVAPLLRQFYWLIPPGKGRITIIAPAGLRPPILPLLCGPL